MGKIEFSWSLGKNSDKKKLSEKSDGSLASNSNQDPGVEAERLILYEQYIVSSMEHNKLVAAASAFLGAALLSMVFSQPNSSIFSGTTGIALVLLKQLIFSTIVLTLTCTGLGIWYAEITSNIIIATKSTDEQDRERATKMAATAGVIKKIMYLCLFFVVIFILILASVKIFS